MYSFSLGYMDILFGSGDIEYLFSSSFLLVFIMTLGPTTITIEFCRCMLLLEGLSTPSA
jgi:hypothetical protein